jgi:hypothetical protein
MFMNAALVGCIAFSPLSASAQQPSSPAKAAPDQKAQDEAKDRFRVGLKLYDDGAYDAARVQFERAYELAPSYKLLYNIGLVYNQLHDFVGALKALQNYLKEGGAEVPADKRAESEKLINDLKLIIASATVTTNVPGVEVSVDDAMVGVTPLSEPILLNPGRRKVSGKLPGRLPDAKSITVASGDKVNVDLNLIEVGKGEVFDPGPRNRAILGWSITAAIATPAIICGILAVSHENKLKDARDTPRQDPDVIGSEARKTRDFSLAADILGGVAIVGGLVSTYLTYKALTHSSSRQEGDKPEEKKGTVTVGFGVGSAGLAGTF